MITIKRYANREAQPGVVTRWHPAHEVSIGVSRAACAGSLAILEVDQRKVRLLPRYVSMQLDRLRVAGLIQQLDRGQVEPQVAETGFCVLAGDPGVPPGCCKRYLDAQVGL